MAFPFEPTVYAGLVALFLGYAWLARDREHTRGQGLYFGLGLLTIWAALQTPIDTISDHYLDSVHMVQHVLLGVIAPPLLLLGLSKEMAATLLRLPGVRHMVRPVPAQVISGSVMIGWHIPFLYNATLYSEPLHVVEHLAFVAAGVIFWWPVLRATAQAAGAELPAGFRLLYLLAGTIPQDGVALALQFSREPFYDFYVHQPRLIDSVSPLIDQTIAGAVLMLAGKISYAIAAVAIFFPWVGAQMRADEAPSPV